MDVGAYETAPVRARTPRPRYELPPVPFDTTPLPVSAIEVVVVDDRIDARRSRPGAPVLAAIPEGATWDVSLPDSFVEAATSRLAPLVGGQGPRVRVYVGVRNATASREDPRRGLTLNAILRVVDESGYPLAEGTGQVAHGFDGPAHDTEELEAMHIGVGIQVLDAFLVSTGTLAKIRGNLQFLYPSVSAPEA